MACAKGEETVTTVRMMTTTTAMKNERATEVGYELLFVV